MRSNPSRVSATVTVLTLLISVMGILVASEREPTSAEPKVVSVVVKDFKFEPATVTVHEGDTVEWKNEDNVAHTATADAQGQKPAFDSSSMATGATWRYVAKTKGTFSYTCTFHPQMKGQLIVQ